MYASAGPSSRSTSATADPQGKAARLDWKAMGLQTNWRATREFQEHEKAIKVLLTDDLLRVNLSMCNMWVKEAKKWRKDPLTGKELDENFNHAMSDFPLRSGQHQEDSQAGAPAGEHLALSRPYTRQARGVQIR